jgi:predicted dinucleotide-binding enzyme
MLMLFPIASAAAAAAADAHYQVLAVRINTVPYAYRQSADSVVTDTVTVTVGDPWQGGACTELTFAYQAG